jgi:hypothetical protein
MVDGIYRPLMAVGLDSHCSHADRTLSRPCPAQKRKNFVSRARTTPLRSVVLSAQNPKGPDYAPPRQRRGLLRVALGRHRSLAESPVPGSFRQHTREGTRPGNKSNGSPQPSKKRKNRRSRREVVAAVAGCLARVSKEDT